MLLILAKSHSVDHFNIYMYEKWKYFLLSSHCLFSQHLTNLLVDCFSESWLALSGEEKYCLCTMYYVNYHCWHSIFALK